MKRVHYIPHIVAVTVGVLIKVLDASLRQRCPQPADCNAVLGMVIVVGVENLLEVRLYGVDTVVDPVIGAK
jgi:hypothetical protein